MERGNYDVRLKRGVTINMAQAQQSDYWKGMREDKVAK